MRLEMRKTGPGSNGCVSATGNGRIGELLVSQAIERLVYQCAGGGHFIFFIRPPRSGGSSDYSMGKKLLERQSHTIRMRKERIPPIPYEIRPIAHRADLSSIRSNKKARSRIESPGESWQ